MSPAVLAPYEVMRPTARIAPIAAALALAAVAVVLTGCGAAGVADPVAAAATKSAQAGGVHISTSITMTFPSGSQGVITGEGTFDQTHGELTVDMSNVLQNTPLPIGTGAGIKARYLTEAGDPVIYLYMPFLASQLPQGKTWIRVDLQKAGSGLGVNFNELLGQAGQSPTQVLDLLRASGGVTEVGPDIVDGTKVTQYHADVDLRKALSLKGVSESAIQQLLDAGAPAEVPVDVWFGDDDGLVRQVRSTSTATLGGQTVTTASLTTLSHWGTAVSVEAPPADKVYDATELAGAHPKA